MKKLIILQVMIAALSMTSCSQKDANTDCATSEDSISASSSMSEKEAFESFAEHFSETASFAYADVCGRKVLLVSQETFGNDADSVFLDMDHICNRKHGTEWSIPILCPENNPCKYCIHHLDRQCHYP